MRSARRRENSRICSGTPTVGKRLWVSLTVLLGAFGVLSVSLWLVWRDLNTPLPVAAAQTLFTVPTGTPLSKVTDDLNRQGLLSRPRLLTWYARLSGDATRIHAGEYQVNPGTTPLSLLDKLLDGDVYLHQFTIIEGWRFDDLIAALRAEPAIAAGSFGRSEIMAALGQPNLHPEGQFLPDTYSFPRGTEELELLRLAHTALQELLSSAWMNRSFEVQLDGPYEALILASIVEKETALADERRKISGVFHRRLQRNMRLQTDPTVIYGLGPDFDGNLRRRDLVSDTPYNTYTRAGLPPTPIALAGRAAIEAAVTPDSSNDLYFVATGLPDRSHNFSPTLEEHNQAVRVYLQRQRNRPQ